MDLGEITTPHSIRSTVDGLYSGGEMKQWRMEQAFRYDETYHVLMKAVMGVASNHPDRELLQGFLTQYEFRSDQLRIRNATDLLGEAGVLEVVKDNVASEFKWPKRTRPDTIVHWSMVLGGISQTRDNGTTHPDAMISIMHDKTRLITPASQLPFDAKQCKVIAEIADDEATATNSRFMLAQSKYIAAERVRRGYDV